jgi:ABC-type transporter Mla subunit MlaD
MPKKQRSELKAGIFMIAALAIMLAVIIWAGAASLFQDVRSRAWFYSKQSVGALGLLRDSDVMVGDVKIGRIANIQYNAKTDRLMYEVVVLADDVAIHRDAKAQVSASSLIGQNMLVLTKLGTDQAGPADADHPVEIAGGLNQAINKLSETVSTEFDKANPKSLVHEIKAVVAELLKSSKDIAKITNKLTPELDPDVQGSIIANVKDTSKNLSATTTKVNEYVQKDLGQIIQQVREISTSVLETANNLSVTTNRVKNLMVVNYDGIDEMVDNMVTVSANLKAASSEIRRNPWRLFYKPDEQKMRSVNLYDAARSFDQGAQQLDDVVTKLKAVKQMERDDPQTKQEIERIRKHLLETFQHFQKVEQELWQEVSK